MDDSDETEFENDDQLEWRDTYFILFQNSGRPTLTQVEAAITEPPAASRSKTSKPTTTACSNRSSCRRPKITPRSKSATRPATP